MPNAAGPHKASNPKPTTKIPQFLGPKDIIGYTPATPPKKPKPTVYFTQGHLTIWHDEPWNIGWDSCVGWTPLFFGNVPLRDRNAGLFTSHDAKHKLYLSPRALVKKLESNSRNRVRPGGWDLHPYGDTTDRILFEFWVRTKKLLRAPRAAVDPMDATDWTDEDWFAHPSRFPFRPVISRSRRASLWAEV
jgi:hypothetical protein